MTDFYVYVHRKATTGEIFYVGKGKDDRAYLFGRNEHWDRTASKYGYTVHLIETGMQEWYAKELEIQLIAYYGRSDLGSGILTNKTDGGDGAPNLSKESRDLMSSKLRGRKATPETIEKMRASMIGKNAGKQRSEEFKKQKSIAMTGKPGKKRSEESKRKTQQSIIEWWNNGAVGKGTTGKKHSDDTRKKMSDSAKARWAK